MGLGMKAALHAYLSAVSAGASHESAVVIAAEAVASEPWDVVRDAGLLARCRLAIADRALGLSRLLRPVVPDSPRSLARIEPGQPYPALDHLGRRRRGAFDTPPAMARQVVRDALDACKGRVSVGLDPACGTGTFLLAMAQAGVPDVFGTDLDATALAVAQIAVPKARVVVEDALKHGPEVDLVCGNPPFVPPERQDPHLRRELRQRFPWLSGRFDLVIPFAAAATERVRSGGGIGLVLPAASLVQPYGAVMRRRWVERHEVTALSGPHPFPGAAVDVMRIAMTIGAGPSSLPDHGLDASELLLLENVPLTPRLRPGDVDLVLGIRKASCPLGTLALVDTGLVAHGAHGSKNRLIRDQPGEGRVPYADARAFFAGEHAWIEYRPDLMHRPKKPAMFEAPKIVIQRLRGRSPVRAAIDRDGIYVGHTCTVVQSKDDRISLEQLLEVITSPISDALVRIERGDRLDLYPRDVASLPVPSAWLGGEAVPFEKALGLGSSALERLLALAAQGS
jgi:SAM-dependent methyltransferase